LPGRESFYVAIKPHPESLPGRCEDLPGWIERCSYRPNLRICRMSE
jgi:hypothetical protein